ncbi:MAG: indole-3-glycerol phosphate synthase TrpC [Candidatus Rokubacteria bacterium]|nr:indole-3-glycerol phosphate synthase TrpC [Candidatus Rokubacteria bacterium]
MSILDDIVGDKRAEVARSRLATPAGTLAARCRALPPARDFAAALRPVAGSVALIAEVKRASPSRGVLGDALDPLGLATTYAEHGAAAISVLTDAKYFQGSLDLLEAIRAAVDVPLLRKDFIIDEYQLWESRAAGADAVLLIVAILESRSLRDLLDAAKGLGLAALVEAHTAGEVDVALATGARILGINNRDLRTFETRIETTLDLLPLVPPGPVVVSESGFFTGSQVRAVAAAGAHAVLVGEGLVTAADIPAKLRELTLRDAAPTGGRRRPGEGTPGEEGPTGGRRRPGEGAPTVDSNG